MSGDGHAARQERSAVRLLQAATATSAFDRFVVGPLLIGIAAGFDVRLSAAATVASAYFLCYGLSQPLWGLTSDRLGRVRTLRVTLALASAAGLLSAVAPTLPLLVVARAATGLCMAAAVPAALIWVGDAIPVERRQRTVTDLSAATAVGITAATALGGALTLAVSWRAGFLLPALSAALLVPLLRRLAEPAREPRAAGRLRAVLRDRWGLTLLVLALVEGGALLGLLPYLTPAAESTGSSATAAGGVAALYGVGLFAASRVVRRLAGRTPPTVFLASGAAGLAAAQAALAVSQRAAVVGLAALLWGAAWAPLHSTMQAWATEVAPGARAAAVSLFAAAVFVGSGATTAALAPWAGDRWSWVFAFGAGLTVVFGLAATVGRAAYGRAVETRRARASPQ